MDRKRHRNLYRVCNSLTFNQMLDLKPKKVLKFSNYLGRVANNIYNCTLPSAWREKSREDSMAFLISLLMRNLWHSDFPDTQLWDLLSKRYEMPSQTHHQNG